MYKRQFLDRSELRGRFVIVRSAALLGYGNLAVDPRKTTIALLNAAAAQSTTIFCPVDIMDIAAVRGGVTAVSVTRRLSTSRSATASTHCRGSTTS